MAGTDVTPAAQRLPGEAARGRDVALMSVLVALFTLRVVGQAAVTYGGATFLPPVAQWQSGLLPYPVLLTGQAILLGLLVRVTLAAGRGTGVFAVPRPRLATTLVWVSYAYAAATIVRYGATMALRPEWRWFGHTIPIVFHGVLAAYVFFVGRCLVRGRTCVDGDAASAGDARTRSGGEARGRTGRIGPHGRGRWRSPPMGSTEGGPTCRFPTSKASTPTTPSSRRTISSPSSGGRGGCPTPPHPKE